MAFFTGSRTPVDLHPPILSLASQSPLDYKNSVYCLFFHLRRSRGTNRWLSTSTEAAPSDFSDQNAYEILNVSETSSFAEIKASFRKLAKETHPDLAHSRRDSSVSQRFVQILAAYEILSDSEKRIHYDRYLLSQRMLVKRHHGQGAVLHVYESCIKTNKQMEVVDWLKWYRDALSDILSEKRVVVGSGYFDVLEMDFYSAIHAAYYGPEIEAIDSLPDCFEAEERSGYETPEVLHLVSGRDLFGMVCTANHLPQLPLSGEKLTSFASKDSGLCKTIDNVNIPIDSCGDHVFMSQTQVKYSDNHTSDTYKDLELHISGKVVAAATRISPKGYHNGIRNKDSLDHIHVFLNSPQDPTYKSNRFGDSGVGIPGSKMELGTVTGLGTNPDEGECFVYNSSGVKTHVIMKHRTLLVKHLHWYLLGDKVSVCECRCSRAQLPPSKYWLFEPRCGMHDIGGWYVETFGRNRKDRTVPSQRHWDDFGANELLDKRLHPAMYLLTLAYRTLDLEDARAKKQKIRDIAGRKMYRVINWCKRLV